MYTKVVVMVEYTTITNGQLAAHQTNVQLQFHHLSTTPPP